MKKEKKDQGMILARFLWLNNRNISTDRITPKELKSSLFSALRSIYPDKWLNSLLDKVYRYFPVRLLSLITLAEEAINLVTRIQDCIENSDKSAFYGEYIAKLRLAEEYERKYLNWAIGVKREISLRILPKKTEVSEEDYITTYERDKILIICEDLMGLATIVKAEK